MIGLVNSKMQNNAIAGQVLIRASNSTGGLKSGKLPALPHVADYCN
jgi:hypothetical protein